MIKPIIVPHDLSSNLARTIESIFSEEIIPGCSEGVVHVVNTSEGFELYICKELRIRPLVQAHGPFKSLSGYGLPEDLHEITGYGLPFFAVERRIEEGEGVTYIHTIKDRKRENLERAVEYKKLLAETE